MSLSTFILAMVVVAFILITFGGLICLLNWSTAWSSWRSRRFVSAVPLVGAVSLGCGMSMLPETKPFFWLALVADYGTLILLVALPLIIYEIWSTSRFNQLHCFRTQTNERAIDIKLFRRQIAVISAKFDPPIPRDDNDTRVQSFGMVGTWTPEEAGFTISGYAADRQLRVSKNDGAFATIELNYPDDKRYKYDCLDGLVLQEEQ